MAHALPTEALIKRALGAWQSCGLAVGGLEVMPNGTVRILAPAEVLRLASQGQAVVNSCDGLFGNAPVRDARID